MVATLKVEKREQKGKKAAKLRASGVLPAVMYGPKEEATLISLDAKEFDKVFKEAGESTIINLEGLGEEKEVLVHDVDYDPVRGGVRHVDFYAIERGKKLQVAVQLEFVGEAPVEKKGGVLTKVLYELEIESLPRNLPHEIEVQLSGLIEFGDTIHVKDLVLPEGVEALADPEDVVVVANEAEEEPEEPTEAPDMDAIEVEQKGKGEDAAEGQGGSEGEKKED